MEFLSKEPPSVRSKTNPVEIGEEHLLSQSFVDFNRSKTFKSTSKIRSSSPKKRKSNGNSGNSPIRKTMISENLLEERSSNPINESEKTFESLLDETFDDSDKDPDFIIENKSNEILDDDLQVPFPWKKTNGKKLKNLIYC